MFQLSLLSFIIIILSIFHILNCYIDVEKGINNIVSGIFSFIGEILRRIVDAIIILITGREVYDTNPDFKVEHIHFEERELRMVFSVQNRFEWERIQKEIKVRGITKEEYFKEQFLHKLKGNIKDFIYIERLDPYSYIDDFPMFERIGCRMIVGKKKSFL